ncbi:Crp/Fnr family transcriptional regulator [Rubrolithibacter danxiaensis]|uniref:Crp/Fnr family transcriptional regulator n=1 Tax=Rubrolithibacter danxiaensis TaxID=3390805 RepID=UPI003BF7FE65
MVDALLQYIKRITTLNEFDNLLVRSYFDCKYFQKGSLLEEQNHRTKNLYFIKSGFVRSFYINEEEEVTAAIKGPDSMITSFKGFVSDSYSESNIHCITDCEIAFISREKYKVLHDESNNWKIFCKAVYEQEIEFNNQRTLDLLILKAESRYLKLIKNNSEIVQNVPIQYLATYLGIKPESLSRIRRKVVS